MVSNTQIEGVLESALPAGCTRLTKAKFLLEATFFIIIFTYLK